MFDVIGRGQLPPGDQVVHQQEDDHHAAEGGDQRALQQQRHRIGLQQRVVPGPDRAPQCPQPVTLEHPGAAHAARQFAQCKAVDRLTHARAGMVLGRGHPAVVTAAVFDREMAVGRHRQHQPRQPLLDAVVLVAQFVRGVQAQAGVGAGHVGQQQQRPPWQVLRAGPPGAADQRHEVQRHRHPGQPAVVAVGHQRRHHRLGWVVLVLADQRVQQRHQTVADQERQPQRQRLTAGLVGPQPEERQQRVDHRQAPGPALAVAVADRAAHLISGGVGDAHGGASTTTFAGWGRRVKPPGNPAATDARVVTWAAQLNRPGTGRSACIRRGAQRFVRRRAAPAPSSPTPRSASVPGSGTVFGSGSGSIAWVVRIPKVKPCQLSGVGTVQEKVEYVPRN